MPSLSLTDRSRHRKIQARSLAVIGTGESSLIFHPAPVTGLLPQMTAFPQTRGMVFEQKENTDLSVAMMVALSICMAITRRGLLTRMPLWIPHPIIHLVRTSRHRGLPEETVIATPLLLRTTTQSERLAVHRPLHGRYDTMKEGLSPKTGEVNIVVSRETHDVARRHRRHSVRAEITPPPVGDFLRGQIPIFTRERRRY